MKNTHKLLSLLMALVMILSLVPATVFAADEDESYVLRTLTFEDSDYKGDTNFAGGNNWSSLIDDSQYGGTLLYGDSGMGTSDIEDAYCWYDKNNTELYNVLSEGYGSWCYWSGGHAISHYASGDISGNGDYDHQLTVYKQGVGDVTTGGGHNGSDNFAVHYGYADNSGYGLTEASLPALKFQDGSSHVIDHMYVNNTTYALNCYMDGNDLTAKIVEGDWVKLIAKGYTVDGKLNGTAEMYLCNGPQNIVTDWTKWDLSGLGEVNYVTFNITGSSDNGYGFSQPAYFAYDDVAVRFPAQATEPEHTHTMVKHEAVAATCEAAGNTEFYSCECGKYFSDAEGTTEIEENSWDIPALGNGHVDVKNNATQANGKDGLCDVCGKYCNNAPVLKAGVESVTDNVVVGEAYLLRDLQAGRIFEDPDGDVLSIAGGGAGNAASKTNYYYNRSTDGGKTWGEELDFASALFGATTISLTEKEPGTYMYRFYAKDGYGGDSRDNESGNYWYLTLNVDAAANLDFDINFFIGQDQNYSTNGNKLPIIKLWKSDGNSNKVGDEIALTSLEDEKGYARMDATVKGGWYVYEGYGWNTETEAYDIPLGGMQIKLPADSNVDGNAGGGTDIYLRVMGIYTSSKKDDGTYFGADDYSVRVTCPIMQCDAVMGSPYVKGNYTYYPVLFYAGGNSCLFNYYLYPTDTDHYMFAQSINGTLTTGTSVQTKSTTINGVTLLTATVPETADFGLYFQYNNFNTSEQVPCVDWANNGDGTKSAVYKVSKANGNYTWRMTDSAGTYVTKAGWLPQLKENTELSLSFDGASTVKNSHDFSQLGTTTIKRDEADLQVFVSPSGAKALGNGTERIRAYRMWQLINSDTANIMIEPDYTWTKLSGPADISFVDDSAVVTGTQIDSGNGHHNWADISANGGTSLFAVHYDAIDLDTSNNATHAGFYPATNPDRVAFVVVADELGCATANVQFNGDYEANSRLDGWDYIYDTWYYLNGEENPALTFTATDAAKVEYAFGLTDGSTMESTVSAFTAIQAEDGTYSVPLAVMNNAANNFGGTVIIRMTDADGKYSYQLVKVARMSVTVENSSYPGEPVMPGNTVKLSFDGLYRSINKIAGIFNPTTFYLRYTMDGKEANGTTGQYQQMDSSSITLNIPADVTFAPGEDTTTVTATNGYVYGSMYSAANPFGAMYYMTDTGVGTNFNAVTVSFAFQKLSDIKIPVVKMPAVAVTMNVVGSDSATVTLTNADGAAQTAENGVYTLGFGTYQYTVEAEGFIKEVGKFTVSSADNGEKTVTVTLRKTDAATWDGTAVTSVTANEDGIYEISTGAELAWFAQQVNAGTGVAYNAKLMNDISLNWNLWTPIGNSTNKYTGTFDGNGHTITDLYCSGAGYQGLFGAVGAKGMLRNFAVTGQVNSTKSPAGGIVAYTNGAATFDGIANYADVNVTGLAGTTVGHVGGIVGQGAATTVIQNCYNAGDICCSCKSGGGIYGCTTAAMKAKLYNCYNVGQVITESATLTSTGALAVTGTADNCYFLDGTTNGTKVVGTAKTADEMKSADFAVLLGDAFLADGHNINGGYPVLAWQVAGMHTEITDEAAAATCTESGKTEGKHCSVCNAVIVAQEAIPALGHRWVDATCTAPKTCSVCQATEGEALGHSWVEATCTAPKTCSVCQATEGEALGHSWVEATCTAPKTCSVCQVTEGEALGHSWVEATCTAPKTCSVCQATEGEALGHSWVDATCTAPKTCSVCQATEGEALPHSYVDTVKAHTYTAKGYTLHKCSVCGDSYKDTYTAMKTLAQAKITSITNTSTGITVKWGKVTGATAYQVYRRVGSGEWKLWKTTTSTSVSNTSLTNGTRYQYKVRAVAKNSAGKIVNTGKDSTIKTMYRLTRPTLASGTKNIATRKIVVKWNKNTKVTGYQVRYIKGTTTRTVTVKGASSLTKTLSSLTKGATYKVYVRSYKTVGSTTYYYSAWSAYKSVKVAK